VTADRRVEIVAAGYDALGDRYRTWAREVVDPRDRFVRAFEAALDPGARVLDLGCGPGVPTTRELARRFVVTGLDLSAAQLTIARREVPEAAFIHADMTRVVFGPGSFDGVVSLYAIVHVPREEHARLLERIARWLAPGGILLAVLGARDAPDWTGDWLGVPMFFSGHDAEEYRRLLAAAGLSLLIDEVVAVAEPEGPADFLWVLAQRT
jgi:cyclopropane fatty-acyl-phospholipid synthase-like methyltransferase